MAHIKVGHQQRTKLFPPNTDPDIIAVWRAEQRLALKESAPAKGTLASDIETYLKQRSSMPSIVDRTREVKMWLPRFGTRPRHSIEHTEVAAQVNEWAASKQHGPVTINHWLHALSNLYRTLDGKTGYNPTRDVPRLNEPDAEDRAIPMSLARRIIAQMQVNGETFGARQGSDSAVRAQILLNTGLRCGELAALVPTDVRLDGAEPFVNVRTLKGGRNRRVPLNGDAVAAFRVFRAKGLWGKFSVSSLRKALHAACSRVLDDNGSATPEIFPHVLRHTFASWLVNDGGVSLKTAQKMLGHRNIQTTVRYVREDEAKARQALKRLESVG